jgi:hypothetical protein
VTASTVKGVTSTQRVQLEAIREMDLGIERAQAMKTLARELDVSVDDVRNELGERSNAAAAAPQGSTLLLADPEPWPDVVEGSELLDDLCAIFIRFLALPEYAAVALALWTVHAHAHDATDISPLLGLTSPVMRCGKTTLLEILGALVPRPLPAANLTAAATFRAVEKFRPTLLVDEADTFLRNSDELRGILNSGHRRRSAIVVRTVGDDYEPRTFSTWCPKVVAMIGSLPTTLADRSIEVRMYRKTAAEPVERMRLDRLAELEPLRRRAWTWAQRNLDFLRAADPDVSDTLNDRAADNWRPLVAIADRAGGAWPERARAAAKALSGVAGEEDTTAGLVLLWALARLFDRRGVEVLATTEVVHELVVDEEAPTGPGGRDLTARDVARLLRPFDIRSRQVRIGSVTLKGYRYGDLADALSRYPAPSRNETFETMTVDQDKRAFRGTKHSEDVSDAGSAGNPCGTRNVSDVSFEEGGMQMPDTPDYPLWSESGRDSMGDE